MCVALLALLVTAQEHAQVQQLVQRLDGDMDGYITRIEVLRLLKAEGHTERYRKEYDRRGTERLYHLDDEVVGHVIVKHDAQLHNDHHIAMPDGLNAAMDQNGDGRLSVHELRRHHGLPVSVEHMMELDFERLLSEVDEDNDGAISHPEAFMHHRPMLHLVSHDSFTIPFPRREL